MTRKGLIEMIRNEIRSLAFETLRNSSNKEKESKVKPKIQISEDELEKILFYGGDEPEEENVAKIMSTTIRESVESGIPQIQASEVKEFENSFEQMLSEVEGASVVFDTQTNGYSLKIWVGSEGIEAGASGVVNLGNNGSVNWSYSLKNGLNINSENLNIDKGNRNLIEKMYSHYNNWQKDWRQRLTISPVQQSQESPEPSGIPQEAPGEEPLP